MQHIPVVSHALWRGTVVLKMLDVVPTIQTPGSYHRQDWCLFTVGKSLTGPGSGEGRWGVGRLRFPIDFNGGERFQRACEWHLLTNRDDCAWLCWPLPGSVHLEKIQGVGGSTVVPLYIQWVGPRLSPTPLVDTMVPPQSVYLSPHPFHSPWPSLQAAFFIMQLYLARGLTERWMAK